MAKVDKNAAAILLARWYEHFPSVRSVVLGGSGASGMADGQSDVDLYVYTTEDVPLGSRCELARSLSDHFEIDNRFWETGDELIERQTGIAVDIMYRHPRWIEKVLVNLLDHHVAQVGYTTCLWHNVMASRPLFDKGNWFTDLQRRFSRPYPNALADAILAKNFPLLTSNIGSFANQMKTSAEREDRVAVNHRVSAFIASYFDILFAINRTPHPGEKRLCAYARLLPVVPEEWEQDLDSLLHLALSGTADELWDAAKALETKLGLIVERP